MSILKFISELFKSNNNSPYTKLKQIKKEIKDFVPKYYNPFKLIFYGSFAHDLYSLYLGCQYFEKPLSHLFLNKKVLETVLILLFNIYVPKEVTAYLTMMEKERIDEVLQKYDFEKTEKYYQKMIQYLKSYLKPTIIKDIDSSIIKMKQLYELTTHNYNDLFLLFNPAFNSTQIKKSLNFNDIKISTRFISSFEDLSFLIANTNIDDSIIVPISTYLKKYSEKDPSFQYDENRIKREINKIIKIINEKFNFSKFEIILKALKEEIDYKIKIIPHNDTYIQNFVNEKIKNSENYLNICKNNEKSKNLKKLISTLFSDITLIKSEIYNEEVSTHFSSNLLPSFTMVKPLEIFRTFIIYYWEGKIKNSLNSFIFKAQYTDESLNEKINNCFHEGSTFIDKINEFEGSLEDLKKYYGILQKKPDSIKNSNSQKNNFTNIVMNTNRNVQNIIQEGLTFLTQLHNIFDLIIEMIESKDQSKISNLLLLIDMTTFKNFKIYNEKIKLVKDLLESISNY